MIDTAKDILVIMTGGTIDAEAYPDPKHPPKDATMLDKSLIPYTMEGLGCAGRCDYLSWTAKDSKAFTDEEMENLAKIIRTSKAKYIIVTHGTDAMPEHSRQIRDLLNKPDLALRADRPSGQRFEGFTRGLKPVADKVVAFTGAMMPLANGPQSDAYQNLEYIINNMKRWKPGVRVVMHGESFDPEGLAKNFDTYQFEGKRIREQQPVRR